MAASKDQSLKALELVLISFGGLLIKLYLSSIPSVPSAYLGINILPIKEDKYHIIEHKDKNIIQCRICHSKSGTLHIISHCYNCVYNNPVQIAYVGFMDTVSSI